LQDPPKFTQIGILGLKINHLATLLQYAMARNLTAKLADFLHGFAKNFPSAFHRK
jgi:hypothetical protein